MIHRLPLVVYVRSSPALPFGAGDILRYAPDESPDPWVLMRRLAQSPDPGALLEDLNTGAAITCDLSPSLVGGARRVPADADSLPADPVLRRLILGRH